MRSLLAVLFLVGALPMPALAATNSLRPPMDSSKCPSGNSTEAPPVRSATFTADTEPSTAQRFLNTAIYCPNACYDLTSTVRLTANYGLAVTVTAKNRCSSSTKAPNDPEQSPKRGCGAGEQRPQITISTKDIFSSLAGFNLKDQTVTRSRCDSSAIQSSVENFFSGLKARSDSQMQAALNSFGNDQGGVDLSAKTSNNLDAALNGDKNASSAILQSFGLTKDQASAAINNNPDQVNRVLQCLSDQTNCDGPTLSKDVAALGVKLNPDLAQQAMLHPEQFINGPQNGQAPNQSPSVGDTFNSGAAGGSFVENLGSLCYAPGMGGCGDACNISAPSLTCRTNNPGAIICSSVASRFGAIGCDPNNNTAIFPTVEAGIAAQASLLTGSSRYFASGNNTILGAFCNGYSTSNCSQYAAFVSMQTGIPMNQTIDPNNSQQIAAIMMASSRFENGRGVIYTPEQLQHGLLAAYGQASLPEGTDGYVLKYYSGTNGGVPFTSPYDFGPDSMPPTVTGIYGSPFANAIPVGYVAPPAPNYSTPAQQTTPATPIPYTGPTPTTRPALPSQPIATLLVQPTSTMKGKPVLVSWSSAGVRSDVPCTVSTGSTTIAQANQGSKQISTSVNSPDFVTFQISCSSQDGTSITGSASVTLH